MSTGPKRLYRKPWISISDQVNLLIRRGLEVTDRPSAESFLRHVNYYRLSGYCLAFEDSRHSFRPGVRFEDLQHAYDFDASLRDLLSEFLENLEVEICTSVAYEFGETYGAFGHTFASSFLPDFGGLRGGHGLWLRNLNDETTRSREVFVKHFEANYLGFPEIPIWATTEIMSFGTMSKMIQAMKIPDQRKIASKYGLSSEVFKSVVHHFSYLRNLCAHHSRVWDRRWSVSPRIPLGVPHFRDPWVLSNRKVFLSILLMKSVLQNSDYMASFCIAWRDRLNNLTDNLPRIPAALEMMGMPENWRDNPLWA